MTILPQIMKILAILLSLPPRANPSIFPPETAKKGKELKEQRRSVLDYFSERSVSINRRNLCPVEIARDRERGLRGAPLWKQYR